MESFLARFRHITVLLLLLMAQLLLLAFQVKTNQEVRLIRIWAVTAVTPLARAVESITTYWNNVFTTLIRQREVLAENERLKADISRLRLDNQYLQGELATADRAKVLLAFSQTIPSKTKAARIIGTGTGANARVVYVDRGSTDGIMRNMAVITSTGIVGKVASAYPTASLVTLITQQGFVAGAVSQVSRVQGIIRGSGSDVCSLDLVRNPFALQDKEWIYTSGDDRVFPKGLPIGQVKVTKKSATEFEFKVQPAALDHLEEVLIVVEGIHGSVPDPPPPASPEVSILPAPPASPNAPAPDTSGFGATDADRLRDKYRKIGESQNLTFGASPYRVPDFNKDPAGAAQPKPTTPPAPGSVPGPQTATPGATGGTAAPKPAPQTVPAKPPVTIPPGAAPNAAGPPASSANPVPAAPKEPALVKQ